MILGNSRAQRKYKRPVVVESTIDEVFIIIVNLVVTLRYGNFPASLFIQLLFYQL